MKGIALASLAAVVCLALPVVAVRAEDDDDDDYNPSARSLDHGDLRRVRCR